MRHTWHRMFFVLLAALLVFTALPLTAFASDYQLQYELSVTSPGGGLAPGSPVNLNFKLKVTGMNSGNIDTILAEVMHVYIKDGVFNFGSVTDITIPNDNIPGLDEGVFKANILEYVDPTGDDRAKTGYSHYRLFLNDSDTVKAYYAATESLTNAAFSIGAFIETTLTETEIETPVMVETTEDVEIGKVEEIIVDPGTPDEPKLSVAKTIAARYEWDSGQTKYVYADTGAGGVKANDLVVFSLVLANNTDEAIAVKTLTDTFGTGYSFVSGYPISVQLKGENTPVTLTNSGDLALLSPDSGYVNLPWTEGTRTFSYTFDPAHEIAADGIYKTYVVLKVSSGSPTGDALKNTFTAVQENGESVTGTITPLNTGDYDLALTTHIPRVYNAAGEYLYARNNRAVLNVSADTYVAVQYLVVNQGAPAKSPIIYAYVPEGFMLADNSMVFAPPSSSSSGAVNNSTNSDWSLVTTIAKNEAAGIWSNLTVYKTSTLATKSSGGILTSSGTTAYQNAAIYLKVVGGKNPADYYVAGEIYSFTDTNGVLATDVDSTPDGNPANDLTAFDGTVCPITSSEKEKAGTTTGRYKINGPTTPKTDEDDFDFDLVVLGTGGSTGVGETDILTKKRQIFTDNSAAASFISGTFNWTLRNYLSTNGYVPLPTGGNITSSKNFVVYDIRVNWDGKQDTAGSTLEDILPKGLKMLSYKSGTTTYYSYILEKYYPSQLGSDGTMVHGDTAYTSCIPLYFAYDTSAPNSAVMTSQLYQDAAKHGVSVNLADTSDGRQKLTISFGTPPPNGNTIEKHTQSAYRLWILAVVDLAALQANAYSPMQNTATYSYTEQSKKATEENTIYWQQDGGASFVRKNIVANNQLVRQLTALPGSDGKLSVDYRIRIRSGYAFGKNEINIPDEISAYFDSFGTIAVTGFSGSSYDLSGDLTDGVAINSPVVTATTTDNKLVIANTLGATAKDQVYYVDFTVNYKDVPYGAGLKNVVEGSTTSVTVPLSLSVVKSDRTDSTPLTGYELKAYYPGDDGLPNTSDPVLDQSGNALVFSDTQNAARIFIPKGHVPGLAGSWQILLMETAAPTGYERNLAKVFPLTVTADSAGKLTLESGTSDIALTFDGKNAATANVGNYKGSDKLITLKKTDFVSGDPLVGARFILTRPGGGTTQLMTSGIDGSVEFALNEPVNGSYAGTYTLVETQAPTGYSASRIGTITVTVAADGTIAAVANSAAGGEEHVAGRWDVITVRNDRGTTPDRPGPGDGGGDDGGDDGSTPPPVTPPDVTRPEDPNSDSFTPIGDEPVPLADLPGLTLIFDDGVPLVDLPGTGGFLFGKTGLPGPEWLMLTALILLPGLRLLRRRRARNG